MADKTIEGQYFSLNNQWTQFFFKWTPRAIVAGFAGYYSLGVAYDIGIMARIDYHAIKAFRHFFGYAGIGAFMPTFQWYSAWSVRIASACIAAATYDLALRVAEYANSLCSKKEPNESAKNPNALASRKITIQST